MRNILLFLVMLSGTWLAAQQTLKPPVTWDEAALREWATPIAGLNVRPGHFSSEEYLKAPVDNLRTYPVYFPGREPAGYWDMLLSIGPKPLIEPAALTSDADWVRAGQRVFDEFDIAAFRVFDSKAIALARNQEGFAKSSVTVRADGTLPDLRWIPSKRVAVADWTIPNRPMGSVGGRARGRHAGPGAAERQRVFQREGCGGWPHAAALHQQPADARAGLRATLQRGHFVIAGALSGLQSKIRIGPH